MNALLLFGALFLFILMGIPIAWSVALSSFTYILVNGCPWPSWHRKWSHPYRDSYLLRCRCSF